MINKPIIGAACICLTVVSLQTSTALAAGIITLPNGFDLYNTGIDVLSGADQHYIIDGSTAFLNTAGHLSSNNANSGWVGPSADGSSHATTNISYDLATTIDLTGINISGFTLSGFWITDNQGVDILVNSVSTNQTNNGFHSSLPEAFPVNAFSLSASDGLVAGLNTIIFRWGNGPDFGGSNVFPDPTQARVQFTEFNAVPVPAAAWLFGSGLIGLVGLARRKA